MKHLKELKAEIQAVCQFGDASMVRHPDDCKRIQRVLADKLNIEWSLLEVEEMWDSVSDERCAGWIYLPDNDDELILYITQHCGE